MLNEFFSIWTFIRTTGFLACYLMTLSLALGLFSSFSLLKKKKGVLIVLHQSSGWYGFLTMLLHVLLIWQDQYVPYTLKELLIPFLAKNEPLLSAFGTLSLYLFLLVIGASDFFMKRLGIKRWKKLHLLVIPAWVLMMVHGLAIGTDSAEPWALFLYAGGIAVILILGILRYLDSAIVRQSSERRKQVN